MNHDHNAPQQSLPADFIRDRRIGWHAFTRFTTLNCVGVAVLLVLMLVFLRLI